MGIAEIASAPRFQVGAILQALKIFFVTGIPLVDQPTPMASRRFAALALLVAVAITAVHADWDDDNPCWGCSDGSCVEVQLNTTGITGKYQLCVPPAC